MIKETTYEFFIQIYLSSFPAFSKFLGTMPYLKLPLKEMGAGREAPLILPAGWNGGNG